VPSLKDHDIPQNWNILWCQSTVNYRSLVRQRNGNIRKYSEVRIEHPNLNLWESKYNSTISLLEFVGESTLSNKPWLTLSLDLSPRFCRWDVLHAYAFQNNSHTLEEIKKKENPP
jgi:hypothetical protein